MFNFVQIKYIGTSGEKAAYLLKINLCCDFLQKILLI